VLTASGSAAEGQDIVLSGALAITETDAPFVPVRIVLGADDAATFDVREVDHGTLQLFSGDEAVPFRLAQYSAFSAIERYEIHAGTLQRSDGETVFDFVAISDPFHIPIIGALLAVAVCPVLAGVSFLSEWIQARTSGWRDACLASGNFPFVVPSFRPKTNLWRGDIECEASARVECRDLSGRVISVHETKPELLNPSP
jgi:hypothetical protein